MAPSENSILAALKTNRLPSLPHVLVDMLHACQGNQASFQDLSQIISRDAAIAARVVSLANSSFYNRGTKINSLERALLVLGTDTIKTIVITASIQQFFSGLRPRQNLFLKQFWKRSLRCALIAKSFAILTSYPHPDEAYLTGLLHNIGELVLETNYSEDFDTLLELDSETERLNEESRVFGVNHADVGAWLVGEWGLSEFTADAIKFHHAPAESIEDAHHLVKLIYLASLLSKADSLNSLTVFDEAEQLFELNASLVTEIVNKIDTEVVDIAASLGISIQDRDSDQAKQVDLAKQVRNIGLLQTATSELNRATSKLELGRAFQSTLELLFGFTHSAVFWYQAEDKELSFAVPEQPDSTPIKFQLESHRSVVARAGIEGKILCSDDLRENDKPLPVVDRQLTRMLKAECLVCIPIHIGETLFCVIAAGSQQALREHSNQRQLLHYFADEIALTCEDTLKHIRANETKLSVHEYAMKVSEIAHEANNPLNIINNYLRSLADKLKNNGELQEELEIVREEVERTGHILLQLKDIQHSNQDHESGVDINQEIKSLVTLYRSSLFLTHDIQCSLELDSTMTRNSANRNALRQILTNLIKNAVEAMPEGGNVVISTLGNINVNGKDFVEINIRDTGPGIPAPVLKDLFKPVSSTKGSGHSGLGLSITKNLVTEAKGTISCRSNTQGTEFQIRLPSV